jgi:hypothetical protein
MSNLALNLVASHRRVCNSGDRQPHIAVADLLHGFVVAGLRRLAWPAQRREKDAPQSLGGAGMVPMEAAPDTYVLDQ